MRSFVAVVALVVLTAAACGSGSGDGSTDDGSGAAGGADRPGTTSGVAATPIVFDTVAKGAQGPSRPGEVVARSVEAFGEVWRNHGGGDPPTLSGVDFDREMVIAVFQGEQPTAGYEIEITAIDGGYRASVTATRPAEGCITAQVMTAPFHVVAVPRSTTEPSFVQEDSVNPC